MKDLNLPTLAYQFTEQNFLPMARGIAYPKILAAMTLAVERNQQLNNQRFSKLLEDIKHNRITGDLPK
jgi:hypothetical protein